MPSFEQSRQDDLGSEEWGESGLEEPAKRNLQFTSNSSWLENVLGDCKVKCHPNAQHPRSLSYHQIYVCLPVTSVPDKPHGFLE